MADREILEIDGRNPFAARLDHVLGAVGDLHVAVVVDGGDVAGVEPAVLFEHRVAFDLVIALGHRRPAHLQAAEGLAVPRQRLAGVVGDLHFDAERRVALFHLDVEASPRRLSPAYSGFMVQSEPSGLISVMPQAWTTSTP